MMNEIKIALVEKNDLFRVSLEFALNQVEGFNVPISVNSCSNLAERLTPASAELLIIDTVNFKEEDFHWMKRLIHNFPEVKTLVLTENSSKQEVSEFIRFGVSAIYSRNSSFETLVEFIRGTLANQNQFNIPLDPNLKKTLIQEGHQDNFKKTDSEFFSERELDVIRLVSRDIPNKEIAEILNISPRTIEQHRRRMIERTGCRSMIGVIVKAYSNQRETRR